MLRNDIIRSGKADRKSYEMFVLLGSIYDAMVKVDDLDSKVVNNDEDIAIATAIRNTLISLNEIEFDFFGDVMNLIDFLDRTAVFERQPYTGNEIIKCITNILDKMAVQFSWYHEVLGQPMTQEEIVELLAYDCDLETLARI